MRNVTEVTLEEARAVPDGDPLARWAATIEALHAKCAALRKRVADVEHDLNREVEARNAAGAELDAVLAHADELTKALRETQRQRDAMMESVRRVVSSLERNASVNARNARDGAEHDRSVAQVASCAYEHAASMLLAITEGAK